MAPWVVLLSRPRSVTAFDCFGMPDRNLKIIYGLLLPMVDLKASRRDNGASQGPIPSSTEPQVA